MEPAQVSQGIRSPTTPTVILADFKQWADFMPATNMIQMLPSQIVPQAVSIGRSKEEPGAREQLCFP